MGSSVSTADPDGGAVGYPNRDSGISDNRTTNLSGDSSHSLVLYGTTPVFQLMSTVTFPSYRRTVSKDRAGRGKNQRISNRRCPDRADPDNHAQPEKHPIRRRGYDLVWAVRYQKRISSLQ